MGISEYRGNANIDPENQESNKAILVKPVPAIQYTVGIASAIFLLQPRLYRWMLIRNFGDDSIWLGYGVPAVIGVNIEVPASDQYFFSPIPNQSIFAISENAPNTRIYLSAI